jgi:hypothetical protein
MSLNLPMRNTTSGRRVKTDKARTDLQSISNESKLRTFMTKNITIAIKDGLELDFDITVVPKRTHVYQGVTHKFDYSKPKEVYVRDFYKNYYDPRNNKAYFVSSSKTASLYGIKKDTSNIVYTTIPDNDNINNKTRNYKYIYPLYYIPGTRGTNIKYNLKKSLNLLNIGDPKTIRLLWHIIENLEYTEADKKEGFDRASLKDLLVETCAEAEYESPIRTTLPDGKIKKTWGERKVIPTKCKRYSEDETDKKLVIFFQSKVVPFLKKHKIHIYGWIYYEVEGNTFHDEILLVSKKYLDFHSTREVKPTSYNDIPTIAEINARTTKDRKKGIIYIPSIDEYKVLMADRRKENTVQLKKNTVLTNLTNIEPYKT